MPGDYVYRYSAGDTIVGRYTVEKALGHGGFSEMYLCTDSRLDRDVALKIIPKERLNKEALHEAKTAAGLDHPQIIQIYDSAEADADPFFISMPHFARGTLQEVLRCRCAR